MRIAPVALFCYDAPDKEVVHIAKDSSLLTHANRLGYNGAVLQVTIVCLFCKGGRLVICGILDCGETFSLIDS